MEGEFFCLYAGHTSQLSDWMRMMREQETADNDTLASLPVFSPVRVEANDWELGMEHEEMTPNGHIIKIKPVCTATIFFAAPSCALPGYQIFPRLA